MVKNPPAVQETKGHHWVGKFPEEGNGNLLQYSYLENSMDRGPLWAIVCRVAKSQTDSLNLKILLRPLPLSSPTAKSWPVFRY